MWFTDTHIMLGADPASQLTTHQIHTCKQTTRERDRQTDRDTDRQRHRETDRQTDRERERERARETTESSGIILCLWLSFLGEAADHILCVCVCVCVCLCVCVCVVTGVVQSVAVRCFWTGSVPRDTTRVFFSKTRPLLTLPLQTKVV